jgi:colanic acid/amylovoran biosynthesis glycosyltransferase
MDIFLFTYHFPYERSEPFLINEFRYAKENIHNLTVLSLYGNENGVIGQVRNERVQHSYILDWPLAKSELIIKGAFNLQPFSAHFVDFFRQRHSIGRSGYRNYFISLLITRAVLNSASYRRMLREIQSAHNPVLYFYWGDYLTWVLPYLAKRISRKDVKVVIRLHNTDLYEERKGNYSPFRRQIFSLADVLLPVSENGRRYLADKYPEFAGKISVARLGVFDHGLNPGASNDKIVVVSASYLVPVKQVSMIFEALQLATVPVIWHHFGGGPLMDQLAELIKERRTGLDVSLHGQVDNQALLEFYQTSHVDVFVNASLAEGVPVSIMEALSFGIPVIAPAVGGIAELVSDDCGALMSAEFSVGELSGSISEFAGKSESERLVLRRNARRAFETKANADVVYPDFYRMLRDLTGISKERK